MRRKYFNLLTFILLILTNFLFAQQRNLWSRIDGLGINDSEYIRKAKLKKYESYALNLKDLSQDLKSAPLREASPGKSTFKMAFPDKNGNFISYLVMEAPVMHPDLAKQFPNNRSYVGISEKDRSKKIRFSVNELGLYAIIMDLNGGVQYIEPLTRDKKRYKVYDRDDLETKQDFQCLTENIQGSLNKESAFKIVDDSKLRTYRLALAANGEYSQYHIAEEGVGSGTDAEKKAVVLAAMTTAITRVNSVFENDLAVSMQLVANNADLIFLDPVTDPYDNDDISAMLDQNQSTCDNVISSENYDIGHVFSTSSVGGVATLAVVCRNGLKARGTTGDPIPTGDNFYFDVVAHEIGHQFGARHTFNGDTGSCGDNGQRIAETAVEPGSGSTLMAYAGYCTPQNVEVHSSLYFHVISIEEIRNYIINGSGGSCAVETDLLLNPNVPVVDAGEDFIIPKGTPYKLVGEASDADGDPVSFCWEQVDSGVTAVPPSPNATTGALYRSFDPVTENTRYLPNIKTLVTGSISSTWEVTPEVSRELNFKLTVRDNNIEAGQVISDDLKVTVTDAAGPFVVTSQNTEDLVWTPDAQETITWDVAGTDGNGVNVSRVNILLSTDGGRTFSTPLATNVVNDGSQIVVVPDMKAPMCFVKVEAVGNFFFSMNTKSFSIGAFNEVCNSYVADDTPLEIPDDDDTGISSVINVSESVSIEKIVLRLIDDSNGSLEAPGVTHTYLGDISINLESPEGTIVKVLNRDCGASEDVQAVFSDEGIELECNFSSPGISGIQKPSEEFSAFIGENSLGNWILTVVDYAADDFGFLESWSLEICSSEAVLGVNNYVFDDFKVFPNPSDGNFTVKFRSEDTGPVDLVVYDLLGRKVANQSYIDEPNNFEQNLELEQLVGGIYILSVKRANKMSSHKIRIK
jgi:subtilisin-like proprotein convertase family protein